MRLPFAAPGLLLVFALLEAPEPRSSGYVDFATIFCGVLPLVAAGVVRPGRLIALPAIAPELTPRR